MSINTMIVQLPFEDGSLNKKAVVTDFEQIKERARDIHSGRLGYHPRFVNYEQLSIDDKKLWDDFISMLIENMKEPTNPDYFITKQP